MTDAEITALAEKIMSHSERHAQIIYGPLSHGFLITLLSERDDALRSLLAERERMREALRDYDARILIAHDALGLAQDKLRGAVEADDRLVYGAVRAAIYTLRSRQALAALQQEPGQ